MRQIPVVFGLLLSLAPVAQEPADTMQRLIGLRGAELNVGLLVGGELTIDGRGSQWHAYIAGFDSGVRRTGSQVSFVLPGNAGEFRGQLRGDRKTMGRQWIQPPTLVLFNQYATHMELNETAPSISRGTVLPLQPRISFYVLIRRIEKGVISAKIRNPEFGWLQCGAWTVEADGLNVTFTGPGTNSQFNGTYDPTADQLTASLLNGAPPILLTRPATTTLSVSIRARRRPHNTSTASRSRTATVGKRRLWQRSGSTRR